MERGSCGTRGVEAVSTRGPDWLGGAGGVASLVRGRGTGGVALQVRWGSNGRTVIWFCDSFLANTDVKHAR